jgi:hypothetical protein
MESQRRQDVADMQRAHESLANTQVELMEANRRLKATEERVRALEALGSSAAEESQVAAEGSASRDDVPPGWSTTPPREQGPGRPTREPQPAAGADSPDEEEPEEQAAPEETLSLRERLARAAAARHRTSQPPE